MRGHFAVGFRQGGGIEPRIFFRVFRAFRGLNDFYYSCPFVSIRGSFPSMDARRNRRAGALERAIHALPSTLFSLLPTFVILSH